MSTKVKENDLTMGPCSGCNVLGEDLPVHHTACECDEPCGNVICDDCRYTNLWAHLHDKDEAGHDIEDHYREVHIDCYHRMTKAR